MFDPSTLVLPLILLAMALALAMTVTALTFHVRARRLPDATRLEDVTERRAVAEAALDRKTAELRALDQAIHERDRFVGEVAALREQLDTHRAEYAALDAARREIDEVRTEAATAAADLGAKQEERKQLDAELDAKRAELQRVIAELDPDRLASIRREIDDMTRERAALSDSLPAMRAERDNALRVVEEARALQTQHAVLQAQADQTRAELEKLRIDTREAEQMREALARAREDHQRLADDTARLTGRRAALATEIEGLEQRAAEVHALASQLPDLVASLAQKRAALADLDNEAQRLTSQIEILKSEHSKFGGPTPGPDGSTLMADLVRFPSVLAAPDAVRRAPQKEAEALQGVTRYLNDYGLSYSRRTIHAFHTALKINDYAQLTVLAGVSGTGKSLLPRRYAEAMGIHFLQIAVEPRWDSPADLLGFYNYVEQRYRASDLARLMVHMDPYDTVPLSETVPDRRDHMALVLLDEMNLARVEYYFSEFLSRLESRPRAAQSGDAARRKDALIPIDIRGMQNPPSLFPAHNVLFVGTMNDDESTQTLSDKVLDRGNILQFPAPRKFEPAVPRKSPSPNLQAQSFDSWQSWVRDPTGLVGTQRDVLDQTLQSLVEIMAGCGRPFGHRLHEAVRAYVANYPIEGDRDRGTKDALSDQIEFRILPKLRGLEIDRHRAQFDELQKLIRDGLGDSQFSDQLGKLTDDQEKGTGLFVWRGLTRESPGA